MDPQTTFISRIHRYIRLARATRRGARLQPTQAKKGEHKEYPRMPRVLLPPAAPLPALLTESMAARTSAGQCLAPRALTRAEVGTLFGHALGMRTDVLRHYPSGGALYPVETYLIGAVEGFAPSVFHYHPHAHALEHLWELPPGFTMAEVLRTSNVPLPPALVLFTSVWQRSSDKYGDFSYSHGLIEAGHMAQNILLVATALGVGARPVSGCDDSTVERLLDIDGRSEQTVYSITLCPPPLP